MCDYENTHDFYGQKHSHTFCISKFSEGNETFGSNVFRSATASRSDSVLPKSAENAVFLRLLRGGFKMNPLEIELV